MRSRPSASKAVRGAREEAISMRLPVRRMASWSGGVSRTVRSMKKRCCSPKGRLLEAFETTE